MAHKIVPCDYCGETVPTEKLARYDRNPNHECERDGHYCSTECYDIGTGAGSYR